MVLCYPISCQTKKSIRYYSIDLLWGAEALSGAAFCAGGDGRHPEHPGKHQPGIGALGHHPALQLPVPDRMLFPGAEAADRGILLPLLVKAYAKAELLPEEGRADTPVACGKRRITQKGSGNRTRH